MAAAGHAYGMARTAPGIKVSRFVLLNSGLPFSGLSFSCFDFLVCHFHVCHFPPCVLFRSARFRSAIFSRPPPENMECLSLATFRHVTVTVNGKSQTYLNLVLKYFPRALMQSQRRERLTASSMING